MSPARLVPQRAAAEPCCGTDADALADLAAGPPFPHARDRVVALGHAVGEKHSGGASSLVVRCSSGGEVVLHHPASGAPSAWRYPEDPALPSSGTTAL